LGTAAFSARYWRSQDQTRGIPNPVRCRGVQTGGIRKVFQADRVRSSGKRIEELHHPLDLAQLRDRLKGR
jgi:hypothetical protein